MKIEKIIFKTIAFVLVQVFLMPNIYWARAAISCPNIYLQRNLLSPSLIIGKSFFQKNFLNDPRLLKRMVTKKLRELKERQRKSLLTNIDDIEKWNSLSVSNFDLWVQWHFDFGEKEVLEKLLRITNSKGIGYLEKFKHMLDFGLPLYNVLFRLVMEDRIEEKESDCAHEIAGFYPYETNVEKLSKYNNDMLRLVFMYRKEFTELRNTGRVIERIDFEGIAGDFLAQSI